MSSGESYRDQRYRMVDEQIVRRGIKDRRVLDAMRQVPRHCFVPKDMQPMAYTDGPLLIGEGQTISQPYIVALMTELLALCGTESVLEVGTGSGYQAAVLGMLAKKVYTIERHVPLSEKAASVLRSLNLGNVHTFIGDGSKGLPESAPFEGILVTASAPLVPQPLLDQLAERGRLVLPVGGWMGQSLEVWQRRGEDFKRQQVLAVAFVPLRGEFGWAQDQWKR